MAGMTQAQCVPKSITSQKLESKFGIQVLRHLCGPLSRVAATSEKVPVTSIKSWPRLTVFWARGREWVTRAACWVRGSLRPVLRGACKAASSVGEARGCAVLLNSSNFMVLQVLKSYISLRLFILGCLFTLTYFRNRLSCRRVLRPPHQPAGDRNCLQV